ncbi:MAG: hypothetical protein LAP21_10820 [Acidobacteriia bacterium]|nr:hypothetical protein [Terriglobia bacterium]
MQRILIACVLFFSCLAVAQECTSYVVINAWEPKVRLDIETLKAGDFAARLDHGKTPLTVVSASQQYNSRLLVLLETDGLGKNNVSETVDTVMRFVRELPEGKPVAFGVYADHAVFTKGFFTSSKERTVAANAVREEAGSLGKRVALYDSLVQAAKLFGERQPGDAVLLVGSPFDDKSHKTPGDVAKAFMNSGIRLIVMLREPMSSLNRDDFLSNSHDPEKTMFTNLTVSTGGAYTDFDPSFFTFAWHGYMLGVKLPEGGRRADGQKWKLTLKGQAAENLKHARLYVPERLPPCGSEPQK